MQLDVKFSLQGAIREDRQTKSFVSYCPALNMYSAGRTRPDAKKALASAVDTYVRLCYERGILGTLLKQRGFLAAPAGGADRATDAEFITVVEQASEYDDVFEFDVPLHLIAQAQAARQESGSCLQ